MIPKRFRLAAIGALTVTIASGSLFAYSASAGTTEDADRATADAFGRIADDVLSQRTQALVDGHVKHRDAAPSSKKKARLSDKLKKDEDAAIASLKSRKTRLAELGESYTAADTRVVVDKATITGGKATVQVTEQTTLTYKKVRGDEPDNTDFKTRYELTLTGKKGGSWELTSIKSQDSANAPVAVNEPVAAKAAAAPTIKDDGNQYPDGTPAATKYPAPAAKAKVLTGGAYDYNAMAKYAEKYWSNYNPAYRKFNGNGGDCTNFISQALKAGGWKPVPGTSSDYRNWWYDGTRQSDSWVGANEWAWFTLSNQRAANLANVYQMDIGDILQVDFNKDGSKDHSMIVSYRSRAGMPYLTYHSTNTYRKSLASIIASYPDARYFAYRT
ncbi:amidase domain-containing protein [Streptomyces sp. NPDC090077]|uniref:amidase domain-containing protein n=1 Tax=Streptomyces sp. NPDC090077 TaxID=3365938 RepID=UPI00382D257D